MARKKENKIKNEEILNKSYETKFNVIEDDEDVIGKIGNLKKFFLEQLKNTFNDENLEEEEKICNLGLIIDILRDMLELNNNVVVKIKFNPMGAYYIADL